MLDFGISHRWAVSQAIKCRFFICQKLRCICSRGYWDFWAINSHKGVKKHSPEVLFFFLKILSAVRTMADLVVLGMGGQQIKIHLRHEGSMIGVQCQLVICRGHIRLPKNIF